VVCVEACSRLASKCGVFATALKETGGSRRLFQFNEK
jgi:hypothetical protein